MPQPSRLPAMERVVSLCCQLCPWCVGNLQEDLPFAFRLQKTGNDAVPFVKYMWMKVLIIMSAFGLSDVLLSLHMNKEYLNKERSQVVLLFEHTISSFNIFIWKVFYINDYICSVLSCEGVFPRMQSYGSKIALPQLKIRLIQ